MSRPFNLLAVVLTGLASAGCFPALMARGEPMPRADGYTGIWYFNQPTRDEYRYKYSGGMATYPQQHVPIAIYCRAVNKTFFCFGGTTAREPGDKQQLLHMVAFYDHADGTVPRPTILLNKETDDAHDNPTMQLDAEGHIWIFSNSHGTSRPSFIHKSRKPYAIDDFQLILRSNFSYGQPWYLEDQGFLFLHTRYARGLRHLYWMTSPDGASWTNPQELAFIEMGDYQVSWRNGSRLGTVFDMHPLPVGLNARANVYYLETGDLGRSWRTVHGQTVALPLTNSSNPALVYDSRKDDLLVYLKDVNYDAAGRPVILFLTSKGFEPGPANGPREWKTARWTGATWEIRPLAVSGNNYDHGSLYVEADGLWRVIAPTEPGPQPYNPGGEMVMWTSPDQGKTWTRVKQLTHNSQRNHTYARRPLDAHPDFYALWADGHARQPSVSHLYFTSRDGRRVWRLPPKMSAERSTPEAAW